MNWANYSSARKAQKSAQKSTVQVCQAGTVVTETTQLVLSQVKNFYRSQWRIEYGLSVPKINISERCELMKLICHTVLIVAVQFFEKHCRCGQTVNYEQSLDNFIYFPTAIGGRC